MGQSFSIRESSNNPVFYFGVGGSHGNSASHGGGCGELQYLPSEAGAARRYQDEHSVLRNVP